MTRLLSELANLIFTVAISFGILMLTIGAWVQHVITSIQNEQWILLLIGIFVPPVGWIHGIGVWIGTF